MRIFVCILSLLLGGIFLVSALPKLCHPKGFILTVLEYRILPPYLSKFYGTILPPLELALALFAITGIMMRFVAIIMSLLLFSFIVAISVNIKRRRDLNCNCFGMLKKRPIGKTLLIQDGMLLAAAIFIGVTHTWAQIEAWSALRLVGIQNGAFGSIFVVSIVMMTSSIIFLKRIFRKGPSFFQGES